MILIGVAIGVSLAALAAMGLLAMAMYVAATEDGRYQDPDPLDQETYSQRLR